MKKIISILCFVGVVGLIGCGGPAEEPIPEAVKPPEGGIQPGVPGGAGAAPGGVPGAAPAASPGGGPPPPPPN